MVAWLSSIEKKDLNYCGKFVLTGDMSELTITKIDLSNMNTLQGNVWWCPKASPYALVSWPCVIEAFTTRKPTHGRRYIGPRQHAAADVSEPFGLWV